VLAILHVSFFSVLWNKEAPVQVHCGTVCALAQVHYVLSSQCSSFLQNCLKMPSGNCVYISWGIIMQIFSMVHMPNPLKPLCCSWESYQIYRMHGFTGCFSLANPLKLLYQFWGIVPLVKLEHLSTGLIHMVQLHWTCKLRNQQSYLEICSFRDPQ